MALNANEHDSQFFSSFFHHSFSSTLSPSLFSHPPPSSSPPPISPHLPHTHTSDCLNSDHFPSFEHGDILSHVVLRQIEDQLRLVWRLKVDHNIPTFDSIDATDRSWLVEMEVDTLTTLDRDCRKGVLGVDGYGDVFASYEFLWGGWVEGRCLKTAW